MRMSAGQLLSVSRRLRRDIATADNGRYSPSVFGGFGCLRRRGAFGSGCGFGGGGFFGFFLRPWPFARDEFLLGLGELERFALEVLRGAAGLGDLLVGRLAVPAGDDRQLLGELAVAEDLDRLLVVGDQARFDQRGRRRRSRRRRTARGRRGSRCGTGARSCGC